MQQQLTVERCWQALQNVEPGSQLASVLEKWKDFTHTVKVNGAWMLEGFITSFRHVYEIMRAIEPSLDPTMPPQCFDPESIAMLFGIPVEELAPWLSEDQTSGKGISGEDRTPQWCHHPDEKPPSEYEFGPLEGTKEKLASWIFADRKREYRRLQKQAENRVVWVRQIDRYKCEVFFRDQAKFANANSRMLADEIKCR